MSVWCWSGWSHWTGAQLRTVSGGPSAGRVTATRPAAARSAWYEKV